MKNPTLVKPTWYTEPIEQPSRKRALTNALRLILFRLDRVKEDLDSVHAAPGEEDDTIAAELGEMYTRLHDAAIIASGEGGNLYHHANGYLGEDVPSDDSH